MIPRINYINPNELEQPLDPGYVDREIDNEKAIDEYERDQFTNFDEYHQ